jgi:Fuc2NAc and GlcNAc transferase
VEWGVVIAVVAGLVSAAAIALVRRNAGRLGLVAAPNGRSSHTRPTPTGGGIGIILGSLLAGLPALRDDFRTAGTLLVTGLAFALLGLCDDIRPLPAPFRLAAQVLIVAVGMVWVFELPPLGHWSVWIPAPVTLAVALLGLVAWVNLFNFMDGIDGLAGSEAVFLLLAPLLHALLGPGINPQNHYLWWTVATAAATIAFLRFNWPPAQIFMGDTGSVFLGWMTGVFALGDIAAGWISPWETLILIACFLTDSVFTLLRRAALREPVWTAHRRHAYQRLSRRFGSHQKVVIGVIAIDLLWLLPLAAAAHLVPAYAPAFTLAAYAPLVMIAHLAGAGRPEHA